MRAPITAMLLTGAVCILATAACGSKTDTATPDSGVSGAAAGPASDAFIQSAGVRLRVRHLGAADAREVVLLVHGGPGLSAESLANLDALQQEDRRIVSYDQRGAGQSDKPSDGDYRLTAQIADLEAIRIWTGAPQVHVLGQSWGGMVAAGYAALHPDRVRSIILLDAAPLDWDVFLEGQKLFSERERALRAEGLVPSELPGPIGDSCLPSLEARLPVYLADPTDSTIEMPTTCTESTARHGLAALQSPQGQTELTRLGRELSRYRGPALVIMGRHDPFGLGWMRRSLELLAHRSPTSLIVEGAGHLTSLEQPAIVLPAIDRWLTVHGR